MTPTKEQLADPAWWSENAPRSATHARAIEGGVDFYKRKDGVWLYLDPYNSWSRDYTTDEAHCVPRPDRAKWTGPRDGLPQVGTQFELLYSSTLGTYATVEVIAHRDGGVVICFLSTPDGVRDGEYQLEHDLTGVTSGYPHARLEETPEQKAARERAEVIDQIKEIICRDGAFDPLDPEVGAAAWALYNNGLRFTETP